MKLAYDRTAARAINRSESYRFFNVEGSSRASQTLIAPFFKPLAYALILLRWQGQPCVFYGDLYGIQGGPNPRPGPSCGGKLPILTRARKLYAYGDQRDYFDKRHCIGMYKTHFMLNLPAMLTIPD